MASSLLQPEFSRLWEEYSIGTGFFSSSKGQLWVSILGRNGARVFFMVLGLGLTILGALITLKVLS